MVEPQRSLQVIDDESKRARRFYTRLRSRIVAWLEEHTDASDRVREYLLLLPDLFALLLRLIGDPRVDAPLKMQLIAASAYVLSPVDLLPDFLLPTGLIDDAIAVAFVLTRLTKIMGDAGEEALREHWEGQGDILAQIQKITATADAVIDQRILQRLRRIFSGGPRSV